MALYERDKGHLQLLAGEVGTVAGLRAHAHSADGYGAPSLLLLPARL